MSKINNIEEMDEWLEESGQHPMTVLIDRLIRNEDKNGLLLLGSYIKTSNDESAKNVYELLTRRKV